MFWRVEPSSSFKQPSSYFYVYVPEPDLKIWPIQGPRWPLVNSWVDPYPESATLSIISFLTHIIVTFVTTENFLKRRAISDCWGKLITIVIVKVWRMKETSSMSICCVFPDIVWSTSVLLVLDTFIFPSVFGRGTSSSPSHSYSLVEAAQSTRPRTTTCKIKFSSAHVPQNTKEKSQAKKKSF